MKMICPDCGKEYNEKMTCCISCGAELVPYIEDREQTPPDCPDEKEKAEPLIPESLSEEELHGFVRRIEPREVPAEKPLNRKPPAARRVNLRGAVQFTGSLLTAAMMLCLVLVSVSAGAVRLLTDRERIYEFTQKLDIMTLPMTVPLGNYEIPKEATVQEAIYVMSQGTGLTREDIRTIYEDSTIRDFLAAQLWGYAEFLRSGDAPEKLTVDKLKGVFSENLPLIDSTMGHELNSHDIGLAYAELERAEPVLSAITPERLENAMGDRAFFAVRLLGSVPAMVVSAALAAAMLVLLKAINKKSSRVLGWGGGAILTGGAAVLAATFLFSIQFPFNSSDRLVRSVLKCTGDVISPDLYRIGTALAITGAVMLLFSWSLKRSER